MFDSSALSHCELSAAVESWSCQGHNLASLDFDNQLLWVGRVMWNQGRETVPGLLDFWLANCLSFSV